MEPAEKTMVFEQRKSWIKKHWKPFFSDMPLRYLSPGLLRRPSAVIARSAENSATFSALEVSTLENMFDCENIQEMRSANENAALLALVDER